MTISPCSQRPANCCAVKLRCNAAPALGISERESSSLWLLLNTGKSFCQGQRGAGEPTCCTHLKSLSQWVQISIGRQCWNVFLAVRPSGRFPSVRNSPKNKKVISLCNTSPECQCSAVQEGSVFHLCTKFEADRSSYSKVIRDPKISNLGHVTQATPI